MGAESRLFVLSIVFLVLEGMVLNGVSTSIVSTENSVIGVLDTGGVPAYEQGNCPFLLQLIPYFGCAVNSTYQAIMWGIGMLQYYATQFFSLVYIPFLFATYAVSTYSVEYPILGVINALCVVFIIYGILHGLL